MTTGIKIDFALPQKSQKLPKNLITS